MKCAKCEKELHEGWKICPFCEQTIEAVVEKFCCSECGKAWDKAWLRCPFCGSKLILSTEQFQRKKLWDRPVDRTELLDLLFEHGLDADDADEKAEELCEEQVFGQGRFIMFKEAIEWLADKYDFDSPEEAIQLAEFALWLRPFYLMPNSLSVFKETYDWLEESMGMEVSKAALKQALMVTVYVKDEPDLEFFKEVCQWIKDETSIEDTEEVLDLAIKIIRCFNSNVDRDNKIEELKSAYDKAVNELDRNADDALAYVVKRFKLNE